MRLVLEVAAGNRTHSMYGLPRLVRLRAEERSALARENRGHGTEPVMGALEQRGQAYVFKLMMKPKVKDLVQKLAALAMAFV